MNLCSFCNPKLLPNNPAFLPENVCDAHEVSLGIVEYLRDHPNQKCTDVCGCMTLEELDEYLRQHDASK